MATTKYYRIKSAYRLNCGWHDVYINFNIDELGKANAKFDKMARDSFYGDVKLCLCQSHDGVLKHVETIKECRK